MIKTTYEMLSVGKPFWKEGVQYYKSDPIKGGGCGCSVVANAVTVEEPRSQRMFAPSEEVEINE